MRWTSVLAIYLLFWTLSLFIVLPFGVRTSHEMGEEKVQGQAESAPHQPNLGRKALWTTLLSAILFGLFHLNYMNGWITPEDLMFTAPPNF